jgi:hypothetical protein
VPVIVPLPVCAAIVETIVMLDTMIVAKKQRSL